MSVRWQFSPLAELHGKAALWDALNDSAGGLPFLSSHFLLPLATEFADGSETLALGLEGGTVVAGALLRREGMGRYTTFQPSQLPLGPWIVSAGRDPWPVAHSLLLALPGLGLGLGLTQLDPRFSQRPENTPRLNTLDYIQTAWVDVAGGFDAYWETRGKNLRTNMGKQRRKLEAEGTTLHMQTLQRPEDMASAVAAYGRLETAGWKAGMGTAVSPDNAQGRFYTHTLENFCRQGRGRVWQLSFGERVVAMDLCIESADTLVVLKTAFDPEFRNVSPAFLLRQDAFRQVFDEGRHSRIEFYGRLMEWHTRWSENSRTLYHANAYRWSLVPRLREQLRRWKPAASEPVPMGADHAG
jgi:CelD/BcsL family acetyltransferase involved in cellulose biosynthesis